MSKVPRYQALTRYARMLGFGEIHTKIDHANGLHALIAIHNTDLGPAIGGCRFFEYSCAELALKDALRLAQMMTLKSAISELPHGGAKSVIFKKRTRVIKDREALFRSFGNFVHEMNGRYIAAIDVNTDTNDMNVIAEQTPYVIGATTISAAHGNPGIHTAHGVLRGIEAVVKFRLNRDDLEGLHIAIQGAGHVGADLAKQLITKGANISICDTKNFVIEKLVDELDVAPVSIDKIYDVDCDIFAPCAMGGVLNNETIPRIKAPIIAGSANNQLAHRKYDILLHEKGITYAPDFVINAGGLIHAAMVHDYGCADKAIAKIDNLYNIMLELFKRAKAENVPTSYVAEKIALERIHAAKQAQSLQA